MEDLKAFIDALDKAEETHERFEKLIAAFRAYEAGNTAVKHNVAFQEIPLLEPVKLLGTATLRLDNYHWGHLNTWKWPYKMRCDVVDTTHYWFSLDGIYCRAVKARFENLQYDGIGSKWSPLDSCFWGFPKMIEPEGRHLYNRLAVEEKAWYYERKLRTVLIAELAKFRNRIQHWRMLDGKLNGKKCLYQ